ncbi:hypothetical protein O181_033607 [Austropuccinia psidii MF-1]|uniref:Uncharacterized protein n=1 Tax=Austropuccinia psidii MF-1 TaxID=1389203 RepID=A0A9Q3D4Y5_9BASI|nr:hypothetical protein [Austropuccinia psidii MF-1]
MSSVHLRNLAFQRNQLEDREGLFRTRRPGRGHLGHSGECHDNEGNHNDSAIHFPIQQEPQTRGLEGYGSSSSAPPTPQRFISLEHVGIPPGSSDSWRWGKQDKGKSSHYPSYRRTTDPDRAYSDSFRLTRSRPNKLSSGFTPFRNQQISGQESPFFTIPGIFQEKIRIQGQKQDHFQPEKERVRPNDPEAVGFGEGSRKEPGVVVNDSRINSPLNINITPTHIENNAVSSESNLNSDALWLQASRYAEQTQKKFSGIEASHERMEKLTAFMDKSFKPLQEGHSQLSKASEETNKRQKIVFEEQNHSRRDRDCLDQDINKLFDVYHNMKPQPQGHVMDNPYYQDEIKPDGMFANKARSP